MKKITSIILSVVLILNIFCASGITVSAETSGDYNYSISGNTATITKYKGSATELIIPSQIDGYTVTSIGNSAFYYNTKLKSVTIPDSVTSIGNRAFISCTINSITIPNSVTSIGESAFYDTSLKSVTIPNSVTSIGRSAFKCCTGLMSVKIYDIAAWCNIEFSDYESNPLYEAQNLYLNDTLVTDLTIPDGVTSIGNYAFCKGTCLNSVTIPGSVTSIGKSAFFSCTSLNGVTIPDSVTSIGDYAFFGTSLNSVTIPDSVTSIGDYAFFGTSLNSVTIPDSVTSIGGYAFYSCNSLTSVTIGNSVTSIGGYAFCSCNSLTNINVDSKNKNYTSVNGNLYNKNKIELIQYAVGKTDVFFSIPNSVTSIGVYAFCSCKSLTSVTIPDSVTSIGVCALSCCTSLTSVTIPNSVTSIGEEAFSSCTSLTSVTIGNNVTSIGESAFYECTSLNSVTIPDSATSIGDYAFFGTSLSSVTIPGSVTSIGDYAFFGTSLNSVTIPDSVTSIGESAFYECTNLLTAVVPIGFKDLNINNIFPSTTKIRYRGQELTVNYDANGGIGAPERQTKYSNEDIELSNSIPTKTGYTFIGWTEHLCSDKYYQPGSVFTENRNITLFAVWGRNCLYCNGKGKTNEEVTCEYCKGKGSVNVTVKCGNCDGSGEVIMSVVHLRCEVCNGTGFYGGNNCFKCKGLGYYTQRELVTCPKCSGTGKVTESRDCRYCWGFGNRFADIICTECNGKGNNIEKVDHKCEWVVTKPATKTQTGIKEKRCVVCGAVVESQIIPKITQYILGDVDGDSEVSIVDATLIQRHLAEIPVYSYNEAAADTDGDGSVTIIDATCIQRYLVQLACPAGIGNLI